MIDYFCMFKKTKNRVLNGMQFVSNTHGVEGSLAPSVTNTAESAGKARAAERDWASKGFKGVGAARTRGLI